LTVDAELLVAAEAWVATPTYEQERDHLAMHPELLGDDADVAVEEALLAVDEDNAERYRELRAAARAHGTDAAYRPILLSVLGHEFVSATAEEQRNILAEQPDDVRTETVSQVLDTLGGSEDEHTASDATRARALLALAELDQHGPVLDALEDPGRFAEVLRSLAQGATPAAVAPAAVVAWTVARTDEERATAGFYLAVAAALAADRDTATAYLAEARALDPTATTGWFTDLAIIGARHPDVLPLIPVLAAPPAQEQPE
jgi:hypothetical protein